MKKGFTTVELLISIVILAIAITIVVASFSKLNSNKALETSSASATSVLDEARSLTLTSLNDTKYGVKIEASQLTLLPTNTVTPLNSLVAIRNISLSTGIAEEI